MTEKCFDIGAIQAFLDGELSSEKSENVARHISACDACAGLLAEAEEETAFAFAALEQELNTLVPTQRLWSKINDSIEREKKSFWKPIFAFLLQPSTAAFAGLLFIFVVVVALLSFKPNATTNQIARNVEPIQKSSATTSQAAPTAPILTASDNSGIEKAKPEVADTRTKQKEIRSIKTSYVRKDVKSSVIEEPSRDFENVVSPANNENVLGEESYVKTIATLTETVKNRKDEVLNASDRFAFERDLAMTDDAITKLKKEVRQNPKNESAKRVLRASYQNKIDLLNSVAEKTELMASLK